MAQENSAIKKQALVVAVLVELMLVAALANIPKGSTSVTATLLEAYHWPSAMIMLVVMTELDLRSGAIGTVGIFLFQTAITWPIVFRIMRRLRRN